MGTERKASRSAVLLSRHPRIGIRAGRRAGWRGTSPWRLGDRAGQHSIRIDDRSRLVFVWQDDGAHAVEIVDYH